MRCSCYLFLILCGLTACTPKLTEEETVLWYAQPADEWMEALLLGNGRIGAMVYGGVQEEKIALNEITLWSGTPHSFGSHLPVSDLKFRFEYSDTVFRDYHRELDLQKAISRVSYRIGDTQYTRETFCSNPDQLLVMRFSADKKGALTFTVTADLRREIRIL